MSSKVVELIGHRGAPREFPENSLPGFRRAFERGASAVELDVHASRDGVAVVHHDPVLRVRGNPAIADHTWKELQQFELAPEVGVPCLEDVLAAIPAGRTAYVELKGPGVEAAALDAIARSGVRCAVHSFDHDMVVRAATLSPDVPRGVLFDERGDVVAAMRRAQATDVWPHWRSIDAALVDAVHDAGGRVIAWTVNSRRHADRLVSLGVDSLCSDDVRLLGPLAEPATPG